MNDIESLAKEAGITAVKSLLFRREQGQEMTWPEQQEWDSVVSFAKRVAEAEREACAKICHEIQMTKYSHDSGDEYYQGYGEGAKDCWQAIRARK